MACKLLPVFGFMTPVYISVGSDGLIASWATFATASQDV